MPPMCCVPVNVTTHAGMRIAVVFLQTTHVRAMNEILWSSRGDGMPTNSCGRSAEYVVCLFIDSVQLPEFPHL